MATKSAGSEKGATRPSTAERAYQIWESEGRPHGRDVEHWNRAEVEISGARGRKVPANVAAAMTAVTGAGRSSGTASKAPAKKAPTGGRKKS